MGTYTWPPVSEGVRPQYTGNWLDGKMNGHGEFTNNHGQVHKGLFVNNLFVVSKGTNKYFLSPFSTVEEHQKTI